LAACTGFDRLLEILSGGHCYIKPSRIAVNKPLSSVEWIGQALVDAQADRLIWGSDWPHLPDGQRDTGEVLNLLADWAPRAADREQILVTTPETLFYRD
jgi:2-pyrone-4,6-dicarboxylate lactonase